MPGAVQATVGGGLAQVAIVAQHRRQDVPRGSGQQVRTMTMTVQAKRIYAPAEPQDGVRVLVDRLWPRGLRKEAAALDLWLEEIATTTALRRDFCHDPALFDAFTLRYRLELSQHPALATLEALAARGPLTLLHAVKDEAIYHAQVLAVYVRSRATKGNGASG